MVPSKKILKEKELINVLCIFAVICMFGMEK